MMAALIANVTTFMFCGTTDAFLGGTLGFFDTGTPYNVPNILLFIGIKIVVYTISFILYMVFIRKKVLHILQIAEGELRPYLVAPAVSVVGFYVIHFVTNQMGIIPTNPWFLPLYATICIIMIVEYVQIFNSVKQTAERMRSEREKERIGAELNIATQIQADMLPSIFPPFPERTEFDLYASMHPAKEVGGDLYDFFLIDDDHIALVMADVSGKGVPEATNADDELFGEARLLQALDLDPGALPKGMLKNVKNAVDTFVGDAPQFDDLTMLGFIYYGTEGKRDV